MWSGIREMASPPAAKLFEMLLYMTVSIQLGTLFGDTEKSINTQNIWAKPMSTW